MTAKKKSSLDDIIGQATPAEESVQVCVAGALIAEHQQLERDLERAQQAEVTHSRLGQANPGQVIAKKMQALQERMREQTHTFRFRALSPKAWSDLKAAHPDPAGKKLVDLDTFIVPAISASCFEPEGMDDPERVGKLFEVLSSGQQEELFDAAWTVNTKAPSVPFSYAASAILRNSAMSSDTARLSESPEVPSSGE